MSAAANLQLVIWHSSARGKAREVLKAIAFGVDRGRSPSKAELAEWADVSPRTVRRCMATLEEHGLIRRTPVDNEPARYEILVQCPPECGRHQGGAAA